jgi:N-alpha-acetyltransferase 35, NatC auxiliary subunit
MKLMSFAWQRMRFNFCRRYKWAFRSEYDDIETPVIAPPEFHRFMPACTETLKVSLMPAVLVTVRQTNSWLCFSQDEYFSPSNSFKFARSILLHLLESRSSGGWAGRWGKERIQVSLVIHKTVVCLAPVSLSKIWPMHVKAFTHCRRL